MTYTPLMKLIAVCGRRRSGKDTIAHHLVQTYGYQHLKISKPMKDAMKSLFGFSDEEMESDKKEEIHPVWNVSPRNLMQYIGTDVFRNHIQTTIPGIGESFWVRRFVQSVKDEHGNTPIVVSDMRFINEYNYIYNELTTDMKVIRVERNHSTMVDNRSDCHISEKQYMEIPYDFYLENTGTIEDLLHKVDEAVTPLQ